LSITAFLEDKCLEGSKAFLGKGSVEISLKKGELLNRPPLFCITTLTMWFI
jgi:hypothetical protein